MAPSRALRLLMQPIKGAIRDQFAQTCRARPRFSSSSPGPARPARPASSPPASLCFRCSLQASFRYYSTDPKAKAGSEPELPSTTASNAASSSPRSEGSAPVPASGDADPISSSPPPPGGPELPSTSEAKRSIASARFSTFMDNLQSRVVVASQALSDLTGYSAIEAIKAQNNAVEADLAAAQARLRTARHTYKTLTATRASTQREVTTLLARKDTWTPADLERFTTLYRSDHELEAQVAAASAELTEAEAEESKLSAALNAGILRRYHEEQIWSDRIRRQSTWGTWGLMGVNVLLFLVIQFVAEPWKRARLIRGVAEREKTHWDEVQRELGEMKAALQPQSRGASDQPPPRESVAAVATAEEAPVVPQPVDEAKIAAIPEVPAPSASRSWKEVLSDPGRWRDGFLDLYSERRIGLRMRDASLIALEGAITGAAVATGVAFMVLRRT